ncbi:hypothetical protein E4U53_003024 [Claviceps sorghi]|nr:hypothetical protein E4U53_003024 [Claviceps sorghi]
MKAACKSEKPGKKIDIKYVLPTAQCIGYQAGSDPAGRYCASNVASCRRMHVEQCGFAGLAEGEGYHEGAQAGASKTHGFHAKSPLPVEKFERNESTIKDVMRRWKEPTKESVVLRTENASAEWITP